MIIYVYGDDTYRLRLYVRQIREKHRSHYQIVEVDTQTDVESEIWGLSLLSSHKLVVVNLDVYKPHDLLLQFLDKSVPDSCMLLVYTTLSMGRSKLHKKLKDIADEVQSFIAFKPWQSQEISTFIEGRAIEKSIKISSTAVKRLVMYYSDNLASVDTELDKLSLYCLDRAIEDKDVQLLSHNQVRLFDLCECILCGDFQRLMVGVRELVLSQPIVPILVGLQSIFHGYLCIKDLSNKGLDQQSIAKKMNIHPFRVKQDVQKLSDIDIDALWNIVTNINQLEYCIKSGRSYDPVLSFELMMQRISLERVSLS